MRVEDLNEEQIEKLKIDYLFSQIENPSYEEIAFASERIPTELIYKEYSGINFVDEDFINQ